MNSENRITDESVAQQPVEASKAPRKHNLKFIIIACVINVALLTLFLTQLLTPAQHQSQTSTRSSGTTGLGDSASPLVGRPAPDFTLPLLSKGTGPTNIHLADLKGKAVILNFWASWCAPCNDEAPFLQKAWPGLSARGVMLIGIDATEKTERALAFMHKYGISYPTVQDTLNSATALDYSVAGLPVTIFINRQGVVVAKWSSPLTEQGLQLEVAKIV